MKTLTKTFTAADLGQILCNVVCQEQAPELSGGKARTSMDVVWKPGEGIQRVTVTVEPVETKGE